MTNPFYTATGAPPAQARGTSSTIRAEFFNIQTACDGINTAINLKGAISGQEWTGSHDFSGASSLIVPTPTLINQAVTKAYADGLSFATVLPNQAGNSGKYITTNGTTASWGLLPSNSLPSSTRTSNTILGSADAATFVDITSGTFAQTFSLPSILGVGWYVYLRNSGTGNITLTPTGGLIDGLSSYILYPNQSRIIQCDGTNFKNIIFGQYFPGSQKFTATGTFTPVLGASYYIVDLVGGGGSGSTGTASSAAGGGGGNRHIKIIPAALVTGPVTVTIAAGGAAQTSANTAGNVGGTTSFGALAFAYGGGGGGAGGTVGGAGGGNLGAGTTSGLGGAPTNHNGGSSAPTNGAGFGGGGGSTSASNLDAGYAEYGGAGGGGLPYSGTGVRLAGSSQFGPGGGGGYNTTSVAVAGSGGASGTITGGGGGAGNTSGVGVAGAAAATTLVCGAGGGGGSTGGGAGGLPGGGGGAAATQPSGAGGNGQATIYWW